MRPSPIILSIVLPSLLLLGACREKAGEKPAGGVSNVTSDELVSPKTVPAIAPFTSRLVLSPEFQWLGAGGDGGGVLRATLDVAAIMSDDPETARRLAEAADLTPPPRAEPEDIDFSGIHDWIARPEDLPPTAEANQTRRFGPWELRVWGRGIGDATVALFREGDLQFAWQGYGFATTGLLMPKKVGEKAFTPFDGPPAGTDLDADGVPDLLIYDYSGGAHCCATVKHIVCSDPPVLTAQISGWHDAPKYADLDGDGKYEMHFRDTSYAYWNACYAASPSPSMVFRIQNGRYKVAADLMRREVPRSGERIMEITRRLSRMDFVAARYQDRSERERVLSAEEKADDEFYGTECWSKGGVRLPPQVWGLLLDLIYSGRVKEAAEALDTMWPPGKPHRQDFAADLCQIVGSSPYARMLPWFGKIRSTFGLGGGK